MLLKFSANSLDQAFPCTTAHIYRSHFLPRHHLEPISAVFLHMDHPGVLPEVVQHVVRVPVISSVPVVPVGKESVIPDCIVVAVGM